MFDFRNIADFIILFIIYKQLLYPRWKDDKRDLLLKTILYLNIVGIIWVTLMPIILNLGELFNGGYRPMHMAAFEDLALGRPQALLQVVLNTIMLLPLGFLLPLIYDFKPLKALAIIFLTSLVIEVIQPLLSSHRSSDITDLITNTLGGFIGIFMYEVIIKKRNIRD